MYRSCKLIRSMTASNGKSIAVAYVDKTDAWQRTFLTQDTQSQFAAVAEKYKNTLKPETVKVAIKYVMC